MFEREDETRNGDRGPVLGLIAGEGPFETRFVLPEPARVGPRLHLAEERHPPVDDLVALQLGVRQVPQHFGGGERNRQLDIETGQVALRRRDQPLPGGGDVATAEEGGRDDTLGMVGREHFCDPPTHRVADEDRSVDVEVIAQSEGVRDHVADRVRRGR